MNDRLRPLAELVVNTWSAWASTDLDDEDEWDQLQKALCELGLYLQATSQPLYDGRQT